MHFFKIYSTITSMDNARKSLGDSFRIYQNIFRNFNRKNIFAGFSRIISATISPKIPSGMPLVSFPVHAFFRKFLQELSLRLLQEFL